MKNTRGRTCLGSLLCVLLSSGVLASGSKTYVQVPAVDWEVLLPYLQANIVPFLHEDEFQVFVCEGKTDRSIVTPFDEELSDFAKVLLMQVMREKPAVADAIEVATGEFRRRVPLLTVDERARYREVFWAALSIAPDLLPVMRSQFLSSQKAGRLRCWLCDRDPRFAPQARRVGAAR